MPDPGTPPGPPSPDPAHRQRLLPPQDTRERTAAARRGRELREGEKQPGWGDHPQEWGGNSRDGGITPGRGRNSLDGGITHGWGRNSRDGGITHGWGDSRVDKLWGIRGGRWKAGKITTGKGDNLRRGITWGDSSPWE